MTLQQATPVLKSSEHGACQVIIQEKVETTLLFGTGADAHVMPGYVGEQLGEPTLQPTHEQDLGAVGEVLVRGFTGRVKVQFKAVIARDARRCLLSGTQLRAKGCTSTVNQKRELSRTTEE